MSRIPSLSGNSSFAVCRLAVADRRPPRTSELTGHCAPVRRRAPERRIRHDALESGQFTHHRLHLPLTSLDIYSRICIPL